MIPENIVGKTITLRKLDERYFQQYHDMLSDEVRAVLKIEKAGFEVTASYLSDVMEKMKNGKTMFYCIFDNDERKLIGAIEIREKSDGIGQLGNWLNEKYRGKGAYQEALKMIAELYFKTTDEDEFNAYVDLTNTRSYYALKKSGFVERGFVMSKDRQSWELVFTKRMLK